MIYNLLFKTGVKYKDIEKYTHFFILIISLYTTINCYLDYDYELTTNILKYYLFGEMIILPFYKYDMIIHHIVSLFLLECIIFLNVNLKINYYSTKQLLLTETSTIFLSIIPLLKLIKNKNNKKWVSIGEQVSMILFVYSFIKTRLYDFYFNILRNDYFIESINPNNIANQRYIVNILTYSLFGLNMYWLTLIIKKVYKMTEKKELRKEN